MADDSKTEKATQKKRRDERKKGHTFLSRDIVSAASLFIIFVYFSFAFSYIYEVMKQSLTNFLGYFPTVNDLTDEFLSEVFRESALVIVVVALPVLIIASVITIIASGAQTRFLIAYDNIKFKFSRLNPINGIKRMFSLKSVVELVKNIIKILIISYGLYDFVIDTYSEFNKLYSQDLIQNATFLFESLYKLATNAIAIFLVIAGFDFVYQWWEYERSIKMTKQEVKEEYKQMEGDPQIKGKIKQRQREMAYNRMIQAVPEADVVIRNPTHFAVALRYDVSKDIAPIVIAKGMDNIALKIIEVAEESSVHVIEDRPLARALYSEVDIGGLVPPDFYGLVAEILALVYKLRKD